MDDNFFKAESNEREVYTYLLKPGLGISYETPKSLVSLNYTLDAYYYRDQDTLFPGVQPVEEEDFVGHTAQLTLQNSPTERLKLQLEDGFNRTRDPASADRFTNSIDRNKYDINRLTPQVSYAFGPKFSTSLKYRHTDIDYDLVTREDSIEKRPIFDLLYNLNRTTSLDLEYQYWKKDYDLATPDFESDQAKLLIRKQYRFFSFMAGGGYQQRKFYDPALKDIDQFTYNFTFRGQNPPEVAEPRSQFSLSVEQNLADTSQFKAQRCEMTARYVFIGKLPCGIRASYQISDYETTIGLTPIGATELRKDKTYNLEGSLGYIFNEWFLFSVTGGFEDRDSNLAGTDYKNQYIIARLDFRYSLGRR